MTNHQHALDPDVVGYIVGTSGTDTFQFVSTPGLMPARMDYCVLRGYPGQQAGRPMPVDVLVQVIDVGVTSKVLDDDLSFDETVAILTRRYQDRPRVTLTARIIGYLDERGSVRRPRFAAAPGHPVHRATDELLRRFFCVDINAGIHVGTLIDRPGVDVLLDPNGLRRHLAIISATGSGKSYLTGRILESLLQMGATALILDPNSDYVNLRKVAADADRPYANAHHTPFADRVDIYRIPELAHYRYGEDLVGPSLPYTVRFADLSLWDILELAGVDEKYVRIGSAVRIALAGLKARGVAYGPRELVRELRRLSQPPPEALDDAEPADLDETDDFEPLEAVGLDGAVPPASAERIVNDGAGAAAGFAERVDGAAEPEDEPEADGPEAAAPAGGDHGDTKPSDFERAINYIQPLIGYTIWGEHSISIERCLEPQRATVLDLAGGGKRVVEYTAARTLTQIWEKAIAGQLPHPVFVVLEEAHNLVPGHGAHTRASAIINTIAAEGRKFHVYLIVVTQRPSKINEDVLSQCGSQVILRIVNGRDQQAIANAVEAASSELVSDLAGLNRGEAVVLGQLTRIPAIITVGGRLSAEGGADIDLVQALASALGTAEVQRDVTGARTALPIRPARGLEDEE